MLGECRGELRSVGGVRGMWRVREVLGEFGGIKGVFGECG